MIWLLFLVVILQAGFHWILTPAITSSTGIFELRGAIFFLIFVFLLIFSAPNAKRDLEERNNFFI